MSSLNVSSSSMLVEVCYNIIGFFNPVTLNKTFFDVRKLSPIGSCACEEPPIRAVAQ